MKLRKKLIHLKKYMYDSTINLKDRTFVIFSTLLITELVFIGIPLGFLMNKPTSSALTILISVSFLISSSDFGSSLPESNTKKEMTAKTSSRMP